MQRPFMVSWNRTLWVTLFLILLTFFVFLNAISKPDARRKERVRHAVRTGFGVIPEMGARSPGVWRRRFDEGGVMELTDLVSRLGPEGAVHLDAGGALWIRLPMEALFAEDASVLSREGLFLMRALKPRLAAFVSGGRVMAHLARRPDREEAEALALSLRRALALADVLGEGVQAWGFGDLLPEFAYGRGQDHWNNRVQLRFPGAASEPDGSFLFRDFLFRIFPEA